MDGESGGISRRVVRGKGESRDVFVCNIQKVKRGGGRDTTINQRHTRGIPEVLSEMVRGEWLSMRNDTKSASSSRCSKYLKSFPSDRHPTPSTSSYYVAVGGLNRVPCLDSVHVDENYHQLPLQLSRFPVSEVQPLAPCCCSLASLGDSITARCRRTYADIHLRLFYGHPSARLREPASAVRGRDICNATSVWDHGVLDLCNTPACLPILIPFGFPPHHHRYLLSSSR